MKKTQRKHVAQAEGLSESTVLDIFKKRAKNRVMAPFQRWVWALGVDEISLRKGHKQYALVLSDLGQRCVIDVLPNRQKDTFETWLDNYLRQPPFVQQGENERPPGQSVESSLFPPH